MPGSLQKSTAQKSIIVDNRVRLLTYVSILFAMVSQRPRIQLLLNEFAISFHSRVQKKPSCFGELSSSSCPTNENLSPKDITRTEAKIVTHNYMWDWLLKG